MSFVKVVTIVAGGAGVARAAMRMLRLAGVAWSVVVAGAAMPLAAWAADAPPAASATPIAAPPAASAAPTHRPLRENQPPVLGEAAEPEVFNGYAAAPPFTVVSRKDHLVLFPCSQCHKVLPLNATPRKLSGAPHNNSLAHGLGRMWCLDCHLGTDRDSLHGVNGAKIDFDKSYLLCGQCHSARQRDWYFGAHGKRVAGWQGERQLYSCTHCHDPHNPLLQPRAPSKPPPVRAGLAAMNREHDTSVPFWRQPNPQGHPDGPATQP